MYPNGPANNGQMPITMSPPGELGGTGNTKVTALDNLVTINPNPPAGDFIPSPGRGEGPNPTRTAGTVG